MIHTKLSVKGHYLWVFKLISGTQSFSNKPAFAEASVQLVAWLVFPICSTAQIKTGSRGSAVVNAFTVSSIL